MCVPYRERATFYPEAMECLANVTQALGEVVSPHMNRLLEPLFPNGLSEQVRGRMFRHCGLSVPTEHAFV